MNKIILCLKTGDCLIGTLESEIDLNDPLFDIVVENPMFIVQTVSELGFVGFKFEDAMLFSNENTMTIKPRDVITTMKPTLALSDYHDVMVEYNTIALRPLIEKQVTNSILDLQDSIIRFKETKAGKKSRFSKTLPN